MRHLLDSWQRRIDRVTEEVVETVEDERPRVMQRWSEPSSIDSVRDR